MEPDWGPARSPDESRVWAEVMPPLAAAIRARSREISLEMLARIGAEMPELVADPDDAETNRASNEANMLLIADLLERGADPRAVELPPPTLAYAEIGAHRNTPLAGLVRAYRIGHAYGWAVLLGILRERLSDVDDLVVGVELLSAWLHEYVDVASCRAEEVYERERERWLQTSAAVRTETIGLLLEGTPADPAVASSRLGYELGRTHVAVVAWLDSVDQAADPPGSLEAALRAVAEPAGSGRPLVHATGLLIAVAWAGLHEPGGDGLAATVDSREAGSPVRIAIGEPGPGVEGFRSSYLEAMEARRVAILAARAPGSLTRYRDVALAAMATADLPQAQSFVRRHVGPLAAGDETSRRLVATVSAFLDEGGSHGRAAHRLGIHENTVRYRVRQAEDLLDKPIGPADLDLRVALALAEVRALGTPDSSLRSGGLGADLQTETVTGNVITQARVPRKRT